MSERTREIRRSTVLLRMLLMGVALFAAAGLYLLQSNWLENKIRQQVIAQAELASGGRVELGSFDYDWRSLTANFGNFVVHGTEPASAAPLFAAKRVSIRLKILSILNRKVDVSSISIERPEIDLITAPDGTTNLPVPHTGPVTFAAGVQALLTLNVKQLELNNGMLRLNVRRFPLTISGKDVYLHLTYERRSRRYAGTFRSHRLQFASDRLPSLAGTLEASGLLERDRVLIRNATFGLQKSTLQFEGSVTNFARPVVDVRTAVEADASEIAAIAKLDDVKRGRVILRGAVHYDEQNLLRFNGHLAFRNLDYQSESFRLQTLSVDSQVSAHGRDLNLSHLEIEALGSRFAGEAALKEGHDLQLRGTIRDLRTEIAASFFGRHDLPWSGVASGRIGAHSTLGRFFRDLQVAADLAVAPAAGATPVSGTLVATFHGDATSWEFGPSSLASAHTRLLFSGAPGQKFSLNLDGNDFNEITTMANVLGYHPDPAVLPKFASNGKIHFDGAITGAKHNLQITGKLDLSAFQCGGQSWNQVDSQLTIRESGVDFASLVLDGPTLTTTLSGRVGLSGWVSSADSPLQLRGQLAAMDLAQLDRSVLHSKNQLSSGIASGTYDLRGTVSNPSGNIQLTITNVNAYGERLDQVKVEAALASDTLQIRRGLMKSGPAQLSFSGTYLHAPSVWTQGRIQIKMDSNGFPLSSLRPAQMYLPEVNAQLEVHAEGALRILPNGIEPLKTDGTVALHDISIDRVHFGDLDLKVVTQGESLRTLLSGTLQQGRLSGSVLVGLTEESPVEGQLKIDQIRLSTIAAFLHPYGAWLPFDGSLQQAGLTFHGRLSDLNKLHGDINIKQLEFTSKLVRDMSFRNDVPIKLEYSNGEATIQQFQIVGPRSHLAVSGAFPLAWQRRLQLKADGAMDLALLELFEPSVRATGETRLAANISGTLAQPSIDGQLAISNGTIVSNDLPNGLTSLNGSIRFDRERATIERMTAKTGGGDLSLAGFMGFEGGAPLVYRLEANAQNIRVRYAGRLSLTASSQLRLTGTSENSLLSGSTTVSRITLDPNVDLGGLLAASTSLPASSTKKGDFLSGLQFDVRVENAPNLQISTELSNDVEAEIDLRLRGTPAAPLLFGSITADQGELKLFGTKYAINRGAVSFSNAVKIEPVLDLDLQTQARGVTVDIVISGTPGKLNISYRSDPPLQPRDIIALLTVGQTPDTASTVPNVSVTNDTNALQTGANTVLGQAFAPASSRLSKLFGITNIKIDPLTQGITNTPQARLTIEQQVSKQITVTYITNLSQTSEQIFRLEWDFSQHYSLVALRDDNGEFGIDIQYRKRFK